MTTPLVSLLRQIGYDRAGVRTAIVRLLEPLGGMSAFVKPGQRVLLKLNLVRACAPGTPAFTHPEILYAVARLAQECGGIVCAGDSPGLGSARKVAKNAGLLPVIDELGIELVEFTPRDIFDESRKFKKLTLAAELLDADVVINLPRLKTHGQMMLTAAVKNLFGAVVGPRKYEWHYRAGENKDAFARMIYEICMTIRPHLHILDAIVSMDGLGPTSGQPNASGFLAAGTDPVAIDATIMRILGREPEELYTIRAAVEAADTAWRETQTLGAAIHELRPSVWHWPQTQSLALLDIPLLQKYPRLKRWFRKISAVFPYALPLKCVKCGACVKICPVQAIRLEEGQIRIRYDDCIRCYCCHELCPHDAIGMRGGWFARLLRLFSTR